MGLKSNDARTRAKSRREFVKVETSRLLHQEAKPGTGRGVGWMGRWLPGAHDGQKDLDTSLSESTHFCRFWRLNWLKFRVFFVF